LIDKRDADIDYFSFSDARAIASCCYVFRYFISFLPADSAFAAIAADFSLLPLIPGRFRFASQPPLRQAASFFIFASPFSHRCCHDADDFLPLSPLLLSFSFVAADERRIAIFFAILLFSFRRFSRFLSSPIFCFHIFFFDFHRRHFLRFTPPAAFDAG
jgi:hypothetical protein